MTAVQGSTKEQVSIDLVPPPVILVHGLWGKQASLQHVKDYLTARSPWNKRAELVQAIQYEGDLAFDTPLVAAALNTAVKNQIQRLDADRIVGGRVDLVAHSMGGLVARHFALLAGFRAPRNRGQGQFHQIITLDTPETGSELATYLYEHRGCTRQRASAIWLAACGRGSSTTIEQCFDAIGQPLGPSGDLKSGGVYSLQPKGPHLQTLNSDPDSGPNIGDVLWRAVSATAPTNSLLRFELDGLISASANLKNPTLLNCPTAATIPSVNSTLHSGNDAVVTVKSQGAGASSNQLVQFSNLAHIPARLWGRLLNLTASNANVEESTAVDNVVACWLRENGDASCKPTPPAAAAAITAAAAPVDLSRLYDAGELTIGPPENVQLGTPFDLVMEAPSSGLSRLVVSRSDELGHHAATQKAPIVRVSGRIVYPESCRRCSARSRSGCMP